jgi:hypothetical protein
LVAVSVYVVGCADGRVTFTLLPVTVPMPWSMDTVVEPFTVHRSVAWRSLLKTEGVADVKLAITGAWDEVPPSEALPPPPQAASSSPAAIAEAAAAA